MTRISIWRRSARNLGCSLALSWLPWAATGLLAQDRHAIVRGIVVDSASGMPLSDVEIALDGQARTRSAGGGRFIIDGVLFGRHALFARRLGFAPRADSISVLNRDSLDLTIRMVPVSTGLAPVVVTAAEKLRLTRMAGFEERRRYGLGKFLTPEDWRGRDNASLRNVLETNVQGIVVGSGGRVASRRMGGCFLSVWVDGVRVSPRGQSMDDYPVWQVIGVEVYRGPSETPVQFGGTGAQCGALVIWTGPSR